MVKGKMISRFFDKLLIALLICAVLCFDFEMPDSWLLAYIVLSCLAILVYFIFTIIRSGKKLELKCDVKKFWAGFNLSVIKEYRFYYMILGAFSLFNTSIVIGIPYIMIYYRQYLGERSYLLIMLLSIAATVLFAVFYRQLYEIQGFKVTVVPALFFVMFGYSVLFLGRDILAVFWGVLLVFTGSMMGVVVYRAMLNDRLPKKDTEKIRGAGDICKIIIPCILGTVCAWIVLDDTKRIKLDADTYLYWINENVFLAAFIMAVLSCVFLPNIFNIIKHGHYQLFTQSGEELFREIPQSIKSGKELVPWNIYPRPQMKREGYYILNGEWKVNGDPVLVPFPPQSVLSGYAKMVKDVLIYEKEFYVPKDFDKNRILLHFGAVDQIAKVWINKEPVGEHIGGYLPFTFDITDAVNSEDKNILRIEVRDSLSKVYPYGKQSKNRGGMWYTPVSGIWQTVWLENVPDRYVENIVITPDLTGIYITVKSSFDMDEELIYKNKRSHVNALNNGFDIVLELGNGEKVQKHFRENTGRIELSEIVLENGEKYKPILWTPDNPFLYQMEILLGEDRVETYFALRTIAIERIDEKPRVLLNGKPIFMHGVLDQGYFSDGIFLPAKPWEYEKDVLKMKEIGINLLRKHIKVEPEEFYYACDRLGMLVMQDMVNSGEYSFLRDTALPTVFSKNNKDNITRIEGKREVFFKEHTRDTIKHLYNHPCIVAYTIFNEGWGQFNSDEMYDYVKGLDKTRLVDSTSGWFAQLKNDFDSEHIYFKTVSLKVNERPLLVSECGGYSMIADGHIYSKYNTFGYGTCADEKELTDEIIGMYEKMILPSIPDGLCGCVYTQLSDVEDEINGLYTYDRQVCKVEKDRMVELAKRLEI